MAFDILSVIRAKWQMPRQNWLLHAVTAAVAAVWFKSFTIVQLLIQFFKRSSLTSCSVLSGAVRAAVRGLPNGGIKRFVPPTLPCFVRQRTVQQGRQVSSRVNV